MGARNILCGCGLVLTIRWDGSQRICALVLICIFVLSLQWLAMFKKFDNSDFFRVGKLSIASAKHITGLGVLVDVEQNPKESALRRCRSGLDDGNAAKAYFYRF